MSSAKSSPATERRRRREDNDGDLMLAGQGIRTPTLKALGLSEDSRYTNFTAVWNFNGVSKRDTRIFRLLGSVTKLVLCHNSISRIPVELCTELWALEHLNLSNNELAELPQEIGKLKRSLDCEIKQLPTFYVVNKLKEDRLYRTVP